MLKLCSWVKTDKDIFERKHIFAELKCDNSFSSNETKYTLVDMKKQEIKVLLDI